MSAGFNPLSIGTGQTIATQASLAMVINGVALPDLAINDEFTMELLTKMHETVPQNYSGRPFRRVVAEGVKVALNLTRQNPNAEMLGIAIIKAFYLNAKVPVVSATITVIEQDDTITEYVLSNGVIDPKHLGTWRSNEPVKGQMLELTFTDIDAVNGTVNPFLALFGVAA